MALSPFAAAPRSLADVQCQFEHANRLGRRMIRSRTASPREAVVHVARRLADLLEAAGVAVAVDSEDGRRWAGQLVGLDPGLPPEHDEPEAFETEALRRWIDLIGEPAVDEADAVSRERVPAARGVPPGRAVHPARSAEIVPFAGRSAKRTR